MLAFLFLLLPLSYTFYCFLKKDKQMLIPSLVGIIFAILICAFRAFFTFTHRVIPYSFWKNFLFYFGRDVIIPIVMCVIYFFVSKDSIDYKSRSFFPLLCSYFIIYLPYTIISSNETSVYTGYDIFLKPIIILAMLVLLSNVITNCKILLERTNKNIFLVVLNLLLALIYIFVPVLIDTMHIMGDKIVFVLISGIIYSVIPFVYCLFRTIRFFKNSKKVNQ